jgi:hypothetical protein
VERQARRLALGRFDGDDAAMSNLAIWAVTADTPTRLPGFDALEKQLETWVERDGGLVLEGVRWVGRQFSLPSRGRLDLLGITREGEWVIAELKAGAVDLKTLHQALGYAMEFGTLAADELLARLDSTVAADLAEAARARMVTILLVGTSRSLDLDRALDFLEQRGLTLTVRVVTFRLFKDTIGNVLMARDVDEREAAQEARVGTGFDRVLELARERGFADEIVATRQLADRLRLPLKVWPSSITINAPLKRRNTLLYVGPRAEGCYLGYSTENFVESFVVSESEVVATLGRNWFIANREGTRAFLSAAEAFITALEQWSRSETARDGSASASGG